MSALCDRRNCVITPLSMDEPEQCTSADEMDIVALAPPSVSSEEDTPGKVDSNLKRSWTPEEDKRLLNMVDKYGATRWPLIACYMPGRVGKQCRERWHNHLRPEVRKGCWTEEEDRIIQESVDKYGTKWSQIVKFLPGRTDNAIKNRYNSNMRKQMRHLAGKHATLEPKLDSCGKRKLPSDSRIVELATALVTAPTGSPQRRQLSEMLISELYKMKSSCGSDSDRAASPQPNKLVADSSESDTDSDHELERGLAEQLLKSGDYKRELGLVGGFDSLKRTKGPSVSFSVDEVLDFFGMDGEQDENKISSKVSGVGSNKRVKIGEAKVINSGSHLKAKNLEEFNDFIERLDSNDDSDCWLSTYHTQEPHCPLTSPLLTPGQMNSMLVDAF